MLKGSLTILTPNKNDSNKRRWETSKKWDRFLKDLEKLKIKVNDEFKKNTSYASMRNWIETSCSKSLIINELVQDDISIKKHNLEIKLIGLLKLNNVDLNLINKARDYRLDNISMNEVQEMIKKTSKELYSYYDDRTWKMFKEKIETMFHSTYEYLINACKLG